MKGQVVVVVMTMKIVEWQWWQQWLAVKDFFYGSGGKCEKTQQGYMSCSFTVVEANPFIFNPTPQAFFASLVLGAFNVFTWTLGFKSLLATLNRIVVG